MTFMGNMSSGETTTATTHTYTHTARHDAAHAARRAHQHHHKDTMLQNEVVVVARSELKPRIIMYILPCVTNAYAYMGGGWWVNGWVRGVGGFAVLFLVETN